MNVNDLVPASGFFPSYLNFVRRLTDAPEPYHIVSAISVMSACCSSLCSGKFEVIAPDGEALFSTFPTNIWSLIVGPSGDRKSTSMGYAVSTAAGLIPCISAISGSPEATFDLVAKKPNTFFYHPEGSTLFSQLQASYWLQGQGFLCDLYDGREDPPYKRILTGKRSKSDPTPQTIEITITRPRVTILIGIAPDLLDQARKSDWTGGLIGRMLLIYGESSRYDETPPREDVVGMLEQAKNLAEIQKALREYKGNMHVGIRPEALEAYMNWARDLDGATRNRPSKMRSLFRRLPLHVIRIAALYAISQYHDRILLDSMVPAIRLGEYSRQSIERVGDLLADDLVMRNSTKIRDMLEQAPGGSLSIGRISSELRMSWGNIEPAVKTLQMSGQIKWKLDGENPDKKWIQLTGQEPE